jgi:hypothetical protein
MLRTITLAALVLIGAVSQGQDAGNAGQYSDSQAGLPSLQQLARERYGQWAELPGCQVNPLAMRFIARQQARLAYGQRMRQAELDRRQAGREHLPTPMQDAEKLAAAKVQLAHLLWQSGKREASRLILFNVPIDYPQTEAAARARDVLDAMDRLQMVAVR